MRGRCRRDFPRGVGYFTTSCRRRGNQLDCGVQFDREIHSYLTTCSIRIRRCIRVMNKLCRLRRYFGYPPLSCHSFRTGGTIDFPQLPASLFSQSSTMGADGRLLDSGPSSTTQVATNSSHNASENPEAGLSGRSPTMTLYMTKQLFFKPLNGGYPVKTYQEIGPVLWRVQ